MDYRGTFNLFSAAVLILLSNLYALQALNIRKSESAFRFGRRGRPELQGLRGMVNLRDSQNEGNFNDVSSLLNSGTSIGTESPLQIAQREFVKRGRGLFFVKASRDALRDFSRNGPLSAKNRISKDVLKEIMDNNVFIKANKVVRGFSSQAARVPVFGRVAQRVIDGPVDTVLDLGSNIVKNIATPFNKAVNLIEESEGIVRKDGALEAGRNLVGKGIRIVTQDGVLKTTGKIIRDAAGAIGVNL